VISYCIITSWNAYYFTVRIHIYWLTGPLLALLFPVTNTLELPLEWTIYWVQHILLLVNPLYLTRLGGQFTLESSISSVWPLLSFSMYSIYHWLILQPIGLVTQANLNNMACPAISDPFHGPYYRVVAMAHQSLLVPLVGTAYNCLTPWVLNIFNLQIHGQILLKKE